MEGRTALAALEAVSWDNPVAETFFATLKKELGYGHCWPTRREFETAVFDCSRASTTAGAGTHTTLGMLSQLDCENQALNGTSC